MAKTWRRLPAKARQQLSDERLISLADEQHISATQVYLLLCCCGWGVNNQNTAVFANFAMIVYVFHLLHVCNNF
jgi:hypothetical protein